MTSLIKFKPRNMRFSLAGADKRNWFGGDPVATAVMDGASILFPVAETFFIASVNHFRDRVTDPVQLEDIRVFQTQEGTHTREHRRYNKAIEAFGGDTGALEARLQADMDRPAVKNASPEYRLALTCAFEHFTGMLAEYLLERPEFLEKADPEFARIWRWHAIEETEHKSVCFDVWNLVKPKGLAGYLMRTRALLAATRILVGHIRYNALNLMKARGYGETRYTVSGLLKFAFVRPGVLPALVPAFLAYFRPGFHPWQKDTRHLIEKYRSAIGAPEADQEERDDGSSGNQAA